MKYDGIRIGKFIDRPNRFIANIEIDGEVVKAHVKNTGRLKELLKPGVTVFVEDHIEKMGSRKLRYSLIAIEKGGFLVNIDSQAPNKLVKEAIEVGKISFPGFGKVKLIRPEYKFGNSRIDIYVEDEEGQKLLIEVKGVTLEDEGVCRFPDAPTERGVKHVEELESALKCGYRACIIFVIQMEGMKLFKPNDDSHWQFGEALRKADAAGVDILAYDCIVKRDSIIINSEVAIRLR